MADLPPVSAGTAKQRMLSGELYRADHSELVADALRARRLEARFNGADPADEAGRWAVLEELLGGGVIVLPGVTIGADTVVGAGAVVTGACRRAWSRSATPLGSSAGSDRRRRPECCSPAARPLT